MIFCNSPSGGIRFTNLLHEIEILLDKID